MRAGPLNEADIFTKNLPGSVFEDFAKTLIGKNEYVHSCYWVKRVSEVSKTLGAEMNPFLIPKQD